MGVWRMDLDGKLILLLGGLVDDDWFFPRFAPNVVTVLFLLQGFLSPSSSSSRKYQSNGCLPLSVLNKLMKESEELRLAMQHLILKAVGTFFFQISLKYTSQILVGRAHTSSIVLYETHLL